MMIDDDNDGRFMSVDYEDGWCCMLVDDVDDGWITMVDVRWLIDDNGWWVMGDDAWRRWMINVDCVWWVMDMMDEDVCFIMVDDG